MLAYFLHPFIHFRTRAQFGPMRLKLACFILTNKGSTFDIQMQIFIVNMS